MDYPDTDVSPEGIEKLKRSVENYYNTKYNTTLTYDEIVKKMKPIVELDKAIEFMFDELNSP